MKKVQKTKKTDFLSLESLTISGQGIPDPQLWSLDRTPACKLSKSGISRLTYLDGEVQQITSSSSGGLQPTISSGNS